MKICRYCGEKMKEHYDYSDRETWYECGCELSKSIEDKKIEIARQKNILHNQEIELSRLERFALYELELRALNNKFGM